MAGDWIKIRIDLCDDPNVYILSDHLSTDVPTVVGLLCLFWGWMDRHTSDGKSLKLTENVIDQRVGCKGFASAMRDVGWLEGENMALELPNFDRHNGNSAKARALESEAKRLRRKEKPASTPTKEKPKEKPQNESVGQASDKSGPKSPTREEKRREEKNNKQHQQQPSADDEIRMSVDWVPGEFFDDRCRMSAIDLERVDQQRLAALLGEFKSYWMNQQRSMRHNQWEHKLLQQVIRKRDEGKLYAEHQQTGQKPGELDWADTSWIDGLALGDSAVDQRAVR